MPPRQRPRQNSINKKNFKKTNEKKISKTDDVATSDMGLIYPGGDTAFKLLLSARFCSAIWSYISDCDETFNYWEPSHYLLYGTGQQTWEYSPEFALRSYTYLLIHLVPAKFYCYLFEPNPILVFYFIRCILSIGCALSEVYFYQNVCKEFGVHVARLTLVFLISSSGMFISSAAFLPSSFSMYVSTAAISAWYARKYELAIFATAISSLLGWPFVALLGVPIVIDLLIRRQEWSRFINWTIISAAVILIPMIWIDSVYYGKLVIAPINLIVYNVFTSHGPDLYGTEPISYYFINGFLNFNFIFIAALFTPLALVLSWAIVPAKPRNKYCLPYWYSLSPLYLWIIVMFMQPHKEERFLFPIYPMICLAGAITVDVIQKLYFFVRTQIKPLKQVSHYLRGTSHIMVLVFIVTSLAGVSRSFALFNGYYAPLEVMMEANKLGSEGQVPDDININFCVGKEWYRFPGSFFFPTNNWRLQYLRSEFKGQLPQAFLNHPNGTSVIQENFNDLNREEPSRYFDIDKCHFILDLDTGVETELEPNYSKQTDNFTIIKSAKFLDSSASHPFFRAFYIPFLSEDYCKYNSYNLLKSNKFKLSPSKIKTPKAA
ncbi:alpha-1,2-mannosyltransferase ALG9 [Microplitis demolitor]|uniref:alpha-1,2-mannosyltransferase ALG9 n=1 Tax=Microplitis demolitor TaxID=69319 RepID=UPI0004CD841D|nr:alpha-1,2-mannosyltransferase ALG9 [Microplitis demolitor]